MGSSEQPVILMSLDEAIKNQGILGGELGKIDREQEENVAGLTGMLYSIPRHVTENRDIHKKFMNIDGEDNAFNDEKDDKPSTMESLSVKGEEIREAIDQIKKRDNSISTLSFEEDDNDDDDDETTESTAQETQNVNGTNAIVAKSNAANANVAKTDGTNSNLAKAKKTSSNAANSNTASSNVNNGNINNGNINNGNIINYNIVYYNVPPYDNNYNYGTYDNGYGYGYDYGAYDNGYGYGYGAYNDLPYYDETNSKQNVQAVKAIADSPAQEVPKENNSNQNAQAVKAIADSPAQEIPKTNKPTSQSGTQTEAAKATTEENKKSKKDETEESKTKGDDEFSYEKLIKLLEDLSHELENNNQDIKNKEQIKESLLALLTYLHESELEELEDEAEGEISSEELEDILKVAGQKKRDNEEEEEEEEDGTWKWQDQSEMDETASKLREEARELAMKGNESEPYGMATIDGINELSDLLNGVLKYSSGRFGKNKPIAELVRNFNSMKTLEGPIIGNEGSLKIVADKEDLTEIAKDAKDSNATRATQLSMEKTYADKISALNKFDYSEKWETMLRNALYDIYNNSKEKDEKVINTGKILLPLLRTKNEPQYYNYDFQYDVLKEIIRQEETYNKYSSMYGGPDPDDKNVEVDSNAAKFVLLRYLMTLFNNIDAKNNKPAPNDDCGFIEGEYFNDNVVSSLITLTTSGNSINDSLKNATNNYAIYLSTLESYLGSNKAANDAVGRIRNLIKNLYNNVKLNLKNPKKKNNVNMNDLKKPLKDLAGAMKNESKKQVIIALRDKISSIHDNINNNSAIVKLCGQKPEVIQGVLPSKKNESDGQLFTN